MWCIEAFAQKNEAEPSDGGRVHGSGDRCEEQVCAAHRAPVQAFADDED